MARLISWLLTILITIDALGTAVIGGTYGETLSAYAYRMERQGKPWGFMRRVIDTLFFWQVNHCQQSYEADRQRATALLNLPL